MSSPGSQADVATISPSELKSLTQKLSDANHWAALLRGRRLRLPWRIASGSWQPRNAWAPNASMGKRARRTPIPHLVPAQPQGWAGTLCFRHRLRSKTGLRLFCFCVAPLRTGGSCLLALDRGSSAAAGWMQHNLRPAILARVEMFIRISGFIQIQFV